MVENAQLGLSSRYLCILYLLLFYVGNHHSTPVPIENIFLCFAFLVSVSVS
jgi:hypothetical protein